MDPTNTAIGSLAVAALALFGSFCVWTDRKLIRRRDVMPIVRAEWTSGSAGHRVKVELVNRLDEDIYVFFIRSKAPLVTNDVSRDDGGSITGSELIIGKRVSSLDWKISPKGTAKQSFQIHGSASPRWIKLRVSSSNGSISGRSILIADRA
jgi:hypothetical protein